MKRQRQIPIEVCQQCQLPKFPNGRGCNCFNRIAHPGNHPPVYSLYVNDLDEEMGSYSVARKASEENGSDD